MRLLQILLAMLSLFLIVEAVPPGLHSLSQTDEGLLAVLDQPWVVRPAFVASSPEQELANRNEANQSKQLSQEVNKEQSREKREDGYYKNVKVYY